MIGEIQHYYVHQIYMRNHNVENKYNHIIRLFIYKCLYLFCGWYIVYILSFGQCT